MTESEQKAREMWEMSGCNINSLAGDLAFVTHQTFDEVTNEITNAIIATVTDILDGETVG